MFKYGKIIYKLKNGIKSGNQSHSLNVKEDILEKIEKKIEKIIKPKIENLGFSLYDVQYVKEGKDNYLRVFIEKDNGNIDLNDCEKVNNEISDYLDEANLIKDQYFLEISSTGVERIIRKDEHLQKHINDMLYVKLFKPLNGKKEYIGKLLRFNEAELILEIEQEEFSINRKEISLIKRYYEW